MTPTFVRLSDYNHPPPRNWLARLAALLGLVLVVDALCLMAVGNFSFGVTLPMAIGCFLLLLAWRWVGVQRWLDRRRGRRSLWRWAWALFSLWLISVVVFFVYLAQQPTQPVNAPTPAALIVLGTSTPNGQPSETLAQRLDTALQQARQYPQALVVVSGGVDFGETISEAEAMANYLTARGLPAARIRQEKESTSTYQNMVFSQKLLAADGIAASAPVQVVSSDFHLLRSRWIAQRAGFSRISVAGSHTPLTVRYNAWLREYFTIISGFVLREF